MFQAGDAVVGADGYGATAAIRHGCATPPRCFIRQPPLTLTLPSRDAISCRRLRFADDAASWLTPAATPAKMT